MPVKTYCEGVYFLITMHRLGKLINRTSRELKNIKIFKCASKSDSANSRFEDKISKEVVLDVLIRFNYRCFYCYDALKPTKWQLDHYFPRANGGKNIFENLVCTCKWCNTMKNALDGRAFLNKCLNIIENNFYSRNNIDIELINKHRNKEF